MHTFLIYKEHFKRKFLKFLSQNSAISSIIIRLKGNHSKGYSQRIEILINTERKFVFILNPKVGSRSIIESLKFRKGTYIVYETNTIVEHLKENKYKFVAFMREPADRAISCYLQKFNTTDYRIRSNHDSLSIDNEMSFEDFANFLLSENGIDDLADKHWMSQSRLLTLSGVLPINLIKIFSYSEFESVLSRFIWTNFSDNFSVPKMLSTSQHRNRITMTSAIASKLEARYADDYSLYKNLEINEEINDG